ncbi:MAG TPA: D-alanyl-D-alanine carboxypeptidase family protein [Candidatus Tectomicrobia bacterium]|nr:D-alanyl-D-alanine carboxypeptidase family protein [Candidatus Tectomicrobia bacterium]
MHATRLLVLLCMPLVALAPADAVAQNGRPPALSAEAVLLLDPEGRTLYAKNADVERAPASLVKLMSLYLACEDIEAGKLQPEELVTVSANAATTPRYRMGLRRGEQVPVRVLLEGVAIASANDAATALAEHVSGDEASFVARMNETGRRLGLADTRFANPHGLPDPQQRSTARDLAALTARLLRDCPMSRTLLGGQTFIWRGRVYARHISLFDDPGGVQALKTGFTNEAGYNLSVSAWRGGQQFLMILLGSRTRARSFLDAKRLLWYGFVEAGLEPQPPPERKKRPPRRPVRTRRARGAR